MHQLHRRLAVIGCATLGGLAVGIGTAAGGPAADETVVRAASASEPIDALYEELGAPPSTTTTVAAAGSEAAPAASSTTATTAAAAPEPAEPAPATTEAPSTTAAPTTTATTAAPAPPPPTAPPAPAPAPATAPAPADTPVEAAIRRWFPDDFEKASEVAWCESRHDPGAVSPGGGNHGLFQINSVHRADFEAVTGVAWDAGIYDASLNAQYARALYDRQGWAPWACG